MPDVPVLSVVSLTGYGKAIDGYSNVVNFSVDEALSVQDLAKQGIDLGMDYYGHFAVPTRYAETAAANSKWGFQASAFASDDPEHYELVLVLG